MPFTKATQQQPKGRLFMQDYHARRMTFFLEEYDRELFCKRIPGDKLGVYRRGYSWVEHQVDDETVLRNLKFTPHFVFALTDNWAKDGAAVPWGSIPVIERLKTLDLWKHDLAKECVEASEKVKASQDRHVRNEAEAFFSDVRDKIKDNFKDYNTSQMKHQKTKQQIKEMRKNGYRK